MPKLRWVTGVIFSTSRMGLGVVGAVTCRDKDSTALRFDDALESSIERNNFGETACIERCGYRAALYLSALIAVVNWSFFTYVQWYLPRFGDGAAIYAVGAVLVLVGLWLQSKIARYVGAAFYFLLAGVVAFNISGLGKQVSVGLVWAVMAAVLSLAAGSILIFSKSFAREFAAEREKRPPYKNYLLHAFTLLIGLAIAAATLIDIVSLASY
jgi:hypothetical protein